MQAATYSIGRYVLYKKEKENFMEVISTDFSEEEESFIRRVTTTKWDKSIDKGELGIIQTQTDKLLSYHQTFLIDTTNVILCLLLPLIQADDRLELFRYDLTWFCSKLKPLFQSEITPSSLEEIKKVLSNWSSSAIDYIPRCLNIVGDKLDFVLHTILQGNRITLMGNPIFTAEFGRFILNVSPLENLRKEKDQFDPSNIFSFTVTPLSTIIIEISDKKQFTINVAESNNYCRSWAKALQMAQNDPLLIRGAIQQRRDTVAFEVSKVRKILELAKLDTYELYKMYLLLKRHENASVILQLLRVLDGQDENANEVLDILFSLLKPQA